MSNPWKLATIGIALTGFTALTTGLTTAWMMRPAAAPPAEASTPPAQVVAVRPALASAPVATRVAPPPAVVPASARVARPAATPVASPVVAPANCASTGDRVWRVAKPAGIGGLLGAGVGAAGGAIANGGNGAGKGALIGGLAGAVLGGGYGIYKTKSECGTVLGGNRTVGDRVEAMTPVAAPLTSGADRITVYHAR